MPAVAVDERDRAPARRRVEVRGVVRHEPSVALLGAHLPQVGRVDRPVGDRQRVLAPGAVVGDGERVLGQCVPLPRLRPWIVSDRPSTRSQSHYGFPVRRLPAESIPRVPEPVRKVVRNAIWSYGRATSRRRPLPGFLVIGAQKAGTTALYAYLRWHPGITGPSWKEVSFFDRHWWRGEAWYRGQFPLRAGGRLVGEASPSYLFHPLAARARPLARTGREADRARAQPGRPRLLAVPARGLARP